ncbi:MAG: class I SAM-dependent methyltransferase [Bacteroidota bacterium]
MNPLTEQFGNIDIYLFDQLLKGRFHSCQDILDAGCGGGRNIIYFLQQGKNVYGVDQNPRAIDAVRDLAKELAPELPASNFQQAELSHLNFSDQRFDLILCSAVLHFAQHADHFDQMIRAMWRHLREGGYFFARLASTIGIETLVEEKGNGRYLLPDGSERYLVDLTSLLHYTFELGGELFEPIKTTNVQNLRAMTTWCISKPKRT